MLKNRLLWTYTLLSIFILGSAISFRSFIFPIVISPLAQFFWVIYRLFASVHQNVYWFLFVGLIVLLAYRIVVSLSKDTQDKYHVELDKPKRREQFWLKTISNAIRNGEDSYKILRRQLGQLFLSASNLNASNKTENGETALLDVQPPLPTKVLSLFKESGEEQKKHFSGVDLDFARHVFPLMWWRKRRMREVIYKEIDEILQSMEDYLEIDHENEPSR